MSNAKKETKEDRLISWLKRQSFILTSEIFAYGVGEYYTSAARRVRSLAERGEVVSRFTEADLASINYKGKEKIYYVYGKKTKALQSLKSLYGKRTTLRQLKKSKKNLTECIRNTITLL